MRLVAARQRQPEIFFLAPVRHRPLELVHPGLWKAFGKFQGFLPVEAAGYCQYPGLAALHGPEIAHIDNIQLVQDVRIAKPFIAVWLAVRKEEGRDARKHVGKGIVLAHADCGLHVVDFPCQLGRGQPGIEQHMTQDVEIIGFKTRRPGKRDAESLQSGACAH